MWKLTDEQHVCIYACKYFFTHAVQRMCLCFIIHTRTMTRSCVWHNSFMCVVWPVHFEWETHVYEWVMSLRPNKINRKLITCELIRANTNCKVAVNRIWSQIIFIIEVHTLKTDWAGGVGSWLRTWLGIPYTSLFFFVFGKGERYLYFLGRDRKKRF